MKLIKNYVDKKIAWIYNEIQLSKEELYMKVSDYNFFFPYENDNDKLIAYNSFSNSLALIEKNKYEKYKRFAEDGVAINDESLVEQLKQGGFLIDDNCNERDLLKFRMLRSRYRTDSLSLTIATTADCNFRCAYCYEKDVIKPDYMTEKVEEAIIKLVESHIQNISLLSVSWYGGEPLMNIGTIERLSRKFIELCEKNKVQYNAGIVTNGYLLTKDNLQLLNDLKVTSLQITLDGNEEIHNKRRPLADGSGTFKTIIGNLISNKDILPHVALRINIDKNNADSGREITKILENNQLLDKVKPYLGRVISDDDMYETKKCFNSCDFSKEEFKYFNEFANEDTYMLHYPRAIRNYCGADSLNSFVIAADGRLYKCWHDIGNYSRCIGKLDEGMNENRQVYLDYMLFDPTTDKECSKCNLLPICMGSCPNMRVNKTDKCSTYKFVLDSFLSVISKRLKLKKQLS